MAKKKEENLVASKVEVKTPIAKKQEKSDEINSIVDKNLENLEKTKLDIAYPEKIEEEIRELIRDYKDESLKQIEKLFISGSCGYVGIMDYSSSDKLDINGTVISKEEFIKKVSGGNNLILDEVEILQFEKLGLLDSIQTIERSKIDLIKECIENGQTLEAIVLLQQLQTGEQWKIQEIIQSLS